MPLRHGLTVSFCALAVATGCGDAASTDVEVDALSPSDNGLNCPSGWDPVWSQGEGANEWWVDFAISGGTVTSARLEVIGRASIALQSSFGRWVGLSNFQITAGTKVALHATNSLGQSAATSTFDYLVTQGPLTLCEGDCVPQCAPGQCGDDGCGGSCSPCGAGLICVNQICTASIPSDAGPSGLPPDFQRTVYASGLVEPTAMAFTPDGRLFVAERAGRLRVIKNGALLTTPFLTVPVATDGERGLVGLAIDPSFATNHYLYVYYTFTGGTDHTGVTRISRFTASVTNPDVVAAGSELILMGNIPNHTFHNSGAMHFGPDGMLYFAVGDNTLRNSAQSLSAMTGKIHRINPAGYPNIIPSDNPFISTPGAFGSIWALGVRNTFTFGIDPTTGQIFGNEVGEDTWEEVNDITRGSNYGWPTCEGNFLIGTSTLCTDTRFKNPTIAYSHSAQFPLSGCSTIGGAFYRGNSFPAQYQGSYFFSDYCEQWLARRTPDGQVRIFSDNVETLTTSLILGPDGSIYYGNIRLGQVFRIAYVGSGNRAPTARATATPSSGTPPLQVSFDGRGSNDRDGDTLTYAWTFGDGATGSGATVLHTYSGTGSFQTQLTVSDGAASATAFVVVTVGASPTANITTPILGSHYTAGTSVSFAGTGLSAAGLPLPASAFSWTVVFHHDDHTHPSVGPIVGVTSGSFDIPTTGELSANVFFRIHLTVTDGGVSQTVTRDVLPNTALVTLQTNPPGLSLMFDSVAVATPHAVLAVAGMQRPVSAPSPQTVGGVSYQFGSWSDGQGQSHTLTMPLADTVYTATFVSAPSSAPDLVIYGDSLLWNNWSWRTTVNTAATAPVFAGTRSIAATYTSAWAGLSFQTTSVNTAPYSALHFAIRPTGALPFITATFQSPAGVELRKLDIRPYARAAQDGWYVVDIALGDLAAANTLVGRVNLQEAAGAAQPTFYLDDVRLVAGGATPPANTFLVYDDVLRWNNWSWGTTLNPSATAPVYAGTRSMAVTYTQAWGGVSLQNAGFDTTPYTHLVFALNPGANPVPVLLASLYDTSNALIRQVSIAPYTSAATGGWYLVAIPLSALGGERRLVGRIQLQEGAGAARPTFFIDDLGFTTR